MNLMPICYVNTGIHDSISEGETVRGKHVVLRWIGLVAGVLTFILVPFFLFGARIESWTGEFIETASDHILMTALVLGGLLATDILLPVPSSIVSTVAGCFLGLAGGTLVSFMGMTISCLAGYALGRFFGSTLAPRAIGADELAKLESLSERLGDWVVVVTRPVPVLAEAAVFFVGMGHMKLSRFILLSSMSNLAISLVYATIGSLSAEAAGSSESLTAFLLAAAGSICLHGIMMLLFYKPPTAEVSP